MEDGGWLAGSVLECGGKRSATPLSDDGALPVKLRRRCALPEQSKTWRRFAALLLLSTIAYQLSTPSAHAQYSIDWFTIDGGVYSVSGTIGQPDAGGPMTGGNYSLIGGFWALPMAIQVTGAPTLTIVSSTPGNATISWTPNTPGFVLQETWSLSPTNWTNSISGSTNPIIVPTTVPSKFYRLFKP